MRECEALRTSCDQARRAGDGRTIIGASLSEPHIDGTAGRFHICITRGMQGIVGRA